MLADGFVVLCDRYCYSNFAYQSARGVPLEWLFEVEKHVVKPDLVFLIDIPVELSFKRVRQASIDSFLKEGILKRLEKEKEILKKVREIYLQLSKNQNWFVIDGTKSIEENSKQILEIVRSKLKLNRKV